MGAMKRNTSKSKKNIRVLCVTDQERLQKIIRENLGEIFGLSIASSGQEGIVMANKTKPHLVLMDMGMHTMSGIVAAQKIKRDMPKTDIIMLTMYQCDSCPTGI